jgi:hypothetical protein
MDAQIDALVTQVDAGRDHDHFVNIGVRLAACGADQDHVD